MVLSIYGFKHTGIEGSIQQLFSTASGFSEPIAALDPPRRARLTMGEGRRRTSLVGLLVRTAGQRVVVLLRVARAGGLSDIQEAKP